MGQNYEIKVSASSPCCSLACSCITLVSASTPLWLSLCLSLSCLRPISIRFRVSTNPAHSHFHPKLHVLRPCFQIRAHSYLVPIWHELFWGRYSTHGLPGGSVGKNLPADAGDAGSTPESGRSPGEEMAVRSSILAWRIPWTQSLTHYSLWDCQRGRHDLASKQHLIRRVYRHQ